ncbi:MAG: long-chain fatty acid--CoA ligase [Bacteroidales bacterium]|nr:long-chain fatty acid--CoA ligase [Bacteroidales bacterium]
MNFKTLKELLHCSTEAFANNKFLCFIGGDFYTFKQFGEKVKAIAALVHKNGAKQGDRVGILCQSMPNWGVAFMSVSAYDKIAVPMLPDFSVDEINNIIDHSECKGIFVSKRLAHKLTEEMQAKLDFIIEVDTFKVLKGAECSETVNEEVEKMGSKEEDLATIIYTSGTTGNSKGVMLTHGNLCSHVKIANKMRPSYEWDVWLSVLPLSHTLEFSLSFLLPMLAGASVYYLEKPPVPKLLMQAFKQVRPTTMLTVPMIIEKIYKNAVLPKINGNPIMAKMYKSAIGRKLINKVVGKTLRDTFGGRMRFYGIGGAKLDGTVERFLLEANFPYAIGYGLTECSPLLAGATPDLVKWQTTGPAVPGVQLRINNPDPVTGEGEIVAKGPNIMPGYYKNPEATKDAFTEDGWFRTKDLGYIDEKGWLSIRGRLNSMIVGPSGENIYPEEIETVINTHGCVAESVVIMKKGALVAKVCIHPDMIEAISKIKDEALAAYNEKKLQLIEAYEAKKAEWLKEYEEKKAVWAKEYQDKKAEYEAKIEEWKREYDQMRREMYKSYTAKREEAAAAYLSKKEEAKKALDSKMKEWEKDIQKYVNDKVNKFSKISHVELRTEAFEKTATQKIKRYLYA